MTCPACKPEPGKAIPVRREHWVNTCLACGDPVTQPPTEKPVTTHDIPALEAAYRDACVMYFETFDCRGRRIGDSDEALKRAVYAQDALKLAKAASEDEGAIRKLIMDAAASCGGHVYVSEADAILAALRAAGYRITKQPSP